MTLSAIQPIADILAARRWAAPRRARRPADLRSRRSIRSLAPKVLLIPAREPAETETPARESGGLT